MVLTIVVQILNQVPNSANLLLGEYGSHTFLTSEASHNKAPLRLPASSASPTTVLIRNYTAHYAILRLPNEIIFLDYLDSADSQFHQNHLYLHNPVR